MAAAPEFDFYLDADEAYEPAQLPSGKVKMGGKEYVVRCPKDSLPMLLGRIQTRVDEAESPAVQEEIITNLVAACFEPEDTADIVERVVDPHDRVLSIAFLVDTVKRVYEQYAPFLDKNYEELGIENPVKQPQDRKPSSKKPRAAKAAAPAKKAAAKKTAAKRQPAPA